MIRIGADFSAAKKGMQAASSELTRFKRDTTRTTNAISGKQGLGGIGKDFKSLGSTVTSSLSQIKGSKGVAGVASSLMALRPAAGAAAAGLRGLGAAAAGASAALGPVGIGIAVVTAAAALATVGIYKASQTAVKFEADLGRLNMQLKGGAKDFMAWSRAQGLAKSTSAELGSTYSVLLSSFIKDNKQLQDSTKQIVSATRVVASATGRTIEDTLERMRSGLLGNTEAIEDLGIFVGVSMIESTKAFKQFAGNKSWDQLDFRVQQQIRLAAILEQTYARYGSSLQNNVMTKQTALMEQLKDVKLNLSQAFLPIWDSVLPALTALTTDVAKVTEIIARFIYRVKGWDYDALTKGTDKQTDSVNNQGNAYDDLGKSAKKARGELAAFDQLNLIGEASDKGSGGGGGTPGPGGSTPPGTDPSGIKLPDIPPLPRLQLKFDPPTPPDAGAGAAATAVTGTVNSLISDTKEKTAGMWRDLQGQTEVGSIGVTGAWSTLWMTLQAQTAAGSVQVLTQTDGMYNTIMQNSATSTSLVGSDWKTMLEGMANNLLIYRPNIETEWSKLKTSTESIKQPLDATKENWHGTLDYMQGQLNAYRPYLEWGWYLTGQSVAGIQPMLEGTRATWDSTLSDMNSSAATNTNSIVQSINSVSRAWESMQRTLGSQALAQQPMPQPIQQPAYVPSGELATDIPITDLPVQGLPGRDIPVIGEILRGLDSAGNFVEDSGIGNLLRSVIAAPGSSLSGIGSAASGAAGSMLNSLKGLLKSPGEIAGSLTKLKLENVIGEIMKRRITPNRVRDIMDNVSAFASGGLVYGPTLAMVGDNRGASSDPEVIAPLSKLEDIMGNGGGSDNQVLVNAIQRVEQAVKEIKHIQAVIGRDAVGRASVGYINEENRRGNNPLLGI